jgi:hypothetical protein
MFIVKVPEKMTPNPPPEVLMHLLATSNMLSTLIWCIAVIIRPPTPDDDPALLEKAAALLYQTLDKKGRSIDPDINDVVSTLLAVRDMRAHTN